MSVAENLAFPLRARKFDPLWIDERVQRIAADLEITQQLPLVASQLSLFQKLSVNLKSFEAKRMQSEMQFLLQPLARIQNSLSFTDRLMLTKNQ